MSNEQLSSMLGNEALSEIQNDSSLKPLFLFVMQQALDTNRVITMFGIYEIMVVYDENYKGLVLFLDYWEIMGNIEKLREIECRVNVLDNDNFSLVEIHFSDK